MSEKQFYLLQVNDALFPIGGYSHSQGLETYIQRGIVHNVDTAREYITHKIKWNLAYTELLAARLAYEAAEKKDLQELLYLEELLEASRIPMEQREAARKMGSRFAKTIDDRFECEALSCYPEITDETCNCSWKFILKDN